MTELNSIQIKSLESWPKSISALTGSEGGWFVQTGDILYAADKFDLDEYDQEDPILIALRCVDINQLLQDPLSVFDAFEAGRPSALERVIYWDSDGGTFYIFKSPLVGAGAREHWYKDEFIDRIKTSNTVIL